MPRAEGQNKTKRLVRLRDLLKTTSPGLSAREIADRTGSHIRTVQRDLAELEDTFGVDLERSGNRYRLRERQQLRPVAFTLNQAVALYLATRLYLRHAEFTDPEAVEALRRLAAAMPESIGAFVQEAANDLDRRPWDTRYARVLQTITDAWARRRVVRLVYRSVRNPRPRPVEVEPYFLEPVQSSSSTYLVGYSRTHQDVRVLKVERVRSAEILAQTYEIPPDMTPRKLLSSAWGIVFKEGAPGDLVTVVLHFDAAVADRLRESTWHPSQRLRDEGDGIRFEVTLGSTLEILPWIRSWGSAVEVLEPADLREQVAEEARRTATRYEAGRG